MGAERFLVKKSLCPHAFLSQIQSMNEIVQGVDDFNKEIVGGQAVFIEKTCQGCTFSYFLFFFSLRTPIHLSTFRNLLFSFFLCNMNMLSSGYKLNCFMNCTISELNCTIF